MIGCRQLSVFIRIRSNSMIKRSFSLRTHISIINTTMTEILINECFIKSTKQVRRPTGQRFNAYPVIDNSGSIQQHLLSATNVAL